MGAKHIIPKGIYTSERQDVTLFAGVLGYFRVAREYNRAAEEQQERETVKKQHPLAQLGYIGAWIGLTILAALTAWQLHITTLYLATLLIDNPALRPRGWSSETLVGVSKLSVLVWGSLWFMLLFYMEYKLREGLQERRLLRLIWWFGGSLLLIGGVAYLLIR